MCDGALGTALGQDCSRKVDSNPQNTILLLLGKEKKKIAVLKLESEFMPVSTIG